MKQTSTHIAINIKSVFRRLAFVSLSLPWSISSLAGVSYFVPGMMNIRDFLVPEKKGIYAALYLGNYSTDKLKDNHGNTIDTATFQASKSLGPGVPSGAKFTADLDTHLDMYLIAPSLSGIPAINSWAPTMRCLSRSHLPIPVSEPPSIP